VLGEAACRRLAETAFPASRAYVRNDTIRIPYTLMIPGMYVVEGPIPSDE
jgi:hypothetical protein